MYNFWYNHILEIISFISYAMPAADIYTMWLSVYNFLWHLELILITVLLTWPIGIGIHNIVVVMMLVICSTLLSILLLFKSVVGRRSCLFLLSLYFWVYKWFEMWMPGQHMKTFRPWCWIIWKRFFCSTHRANETGSGMREAGDFIYIPVSQCSSMKPKIVIILASMAIAATVSLLVSSSIVEAYA